MREHTERNTIGMHAIFEWLMGSITWMDIFILTGVFFAGGWAMKLASYVIEQRRRRYILKQLRDDERIHNILRKM
jgi:uncharacterized membrane protein SpoIIM required for sporulation